MATRGALIALIALATSLAQAADEPWLATRAQGRLEWFRVGPVALEPAADPILPAQPLGSLWKLFVYAYLVAQYRDAPDYQCRGGDPEEVYCCPPGGRIGREAALVRSCGRYFEPRRLGIASDEWAEFWRARRAPDWLTRLDAVAEGRRVPVPELIEGLEAVPEAARGEAARTLLEVLAGERAGDALAFYGGMLRPKTWTMPDPQREGTRIGGAGGWFANGQPFWLGGRGAGIEVLRAAAPALSAHLAGLAVADQGCVEVRYFARYPLARVLRRPDLAPAAEGPLHGEFRAVFGNGNTLDFSSRGELRLAVEEGRPVLRGRLGINEYVARVIDREASPEPLEAARALAVVARSYLVQQARAAGGCYLIDDDSATQRVAPRPASAAARAIADWSTDLVLHGMTVRYHLDQGAPGVLAWREATRAAAAGERFDRILAGSFPAAGLAAIGTTPMPACRPAPEAASWLASRVPRWRRTLAAEPGYAEPDPLPAVCMAEGARPYADPDRHRLLVRGWTRQQDRLALAHEYLHLAFEGHPTGLDEAAVERLARRLILELP